jgi:hypothetical protein
MASSLIKLSSRFLRLRDQLDESTMSLGDGLSSDEKKEADHEAYADRLGQQMMRLTCALARTPAKSSEELVHTWLWIGLEKMVTFPIYFPCLYAATSSISTVTTQSSETTHPILCWMLEHTHDSPLLPRASQ